MHQKHSIRGWYGNQEHSRTPHLDPSSSGQPYCGSLLFWAGRIFSNFYPFLYYFSIFSPFHLLRIHVVFFHYDVYPDLCDASTEIKGIQPVVGQAMANHILGLKVRVVERAVLWVTGLGAGTLRSTLVKEFIFRSSFPFDENTIPDLFQDPASHLLTSPTPERHGHNIGSKNLPQKSHVTR